MPTRVFLDSSYSTEEGATHAVILGDGTIAKTDERGAEQIIILSSYLNFLRDIFLWNLARGPRNIVQQALDEVLYTPRTEEEEARMTLQPDEMTKFRAIVVGGEKYFVMGTVKKNLLRCGIEVAEHWTNVPPNSSPPRGTIIVALIDLCPHSLYEAAKNLAERCDLLFITGSRKWSFMQKALSDKGLAELTEEEIQARIETSQTPEEALEKFESHRVSPDVVLSLWKTKKSGKKSWSLVEKRGGREGRRRQIDLGELSENRARTCFAGLIACWLEKPSAHHTNMEDVVELGSEKPGEDLAAVRSRQELVVFELEEIGKLERSADNPLVPVGQVPKQNGQVSGLSRASVLEPVRIEQNRIVELKPVKKEDLNMAELKTVPPSKNLEKPATDEEIVKKARELQQMVKSRADLAGLIIPTPAEGNIRIQKRVVTIIEDEIS